MTLHLLLSGGISIKILGGKGEGARENFRGGGQKSKKKNAHKACKNLPYAKMVKFGLI